MLDFVFLNDLEERPQLHFLAPYVLQHFIPNGHLRFEAGQLSSFTALVQKPSVLLRLC